MKSKILLIKPNIYLIILILTSLKIFFSTTISYAENFDIKNIEISKKFDINFQKTDILDEGFKIAYQNLISNITKSDDQNELKNFNLSNIKTTINSFSIKEEKFIDNIYYVNLDVSFSKKKIFSLLEQKNIFPSLPKIKKVLFVPVIIDERQNDLILFSENIFFKKWLVENNEENQLIYVLPTEDLDDFQIIKSNYEFLEEYDFKEIINKYSLDSYIISLIYKNNDSLRVLSKIKLSDTMVLDNQIYKNFSDEKLMETISQLKIIYEDYWKNENQINTSIKLPLKIAIDITNDKKIRSFENTIKKFDLVSSIFVSQLDNKMIYYNVIFNGTPKSFILEMQKLGHELDIKNKVWILK